MRINRLIALVFIATLSLLTAPTIAQTPVEGIPTDAGTLNHSLVPGTTYVQVLAAAPPTTNNSNPRRAITIQNNNTNTDNCFVDDTGLVAIGNSTATSVTTTDGNTITSGQASILLSPGGSYQRYWPMIPNGRIVAVCAGGSDSLFIAVQ